MSSLGNRRADQKLNCDYAHSRKYPDVGILKSTPVFLMKTLHLVICLLRLRSLVSRLIKYLCCEPDEEQSADTLKL